MKIKELIEKDKQLQKDLKNEEVCELCATHEAAYRQLKNEFLCPHCNRLLDDIYYYDENDWVVVGQDNSVMEDDEINKFPVFTCPNCGKWFALVVRPIKYNANHDVFYTGKRYLPKYDEQEMIKILTPTIKGYLDRYEKEKDLTADYLALWVARDFEEYVANIMYENELKW